ncbi:MAG: L-seryl-tRNA(Sec) selenium transferase [Thermodesulfobacteriota bacterium]
MKKDKTPVADHQLLKAIPKVDEFLGWISDEGQAPLRLVKKAVRELLDDVRQAILGGQEQSVESLGKSLLLPRFHKRLAALMEPNFRTVINATGVVVHTNMGRSLLPDSAMAGLLAAGGRYSNLEFDLATGKRGSRYSLVEDLLCELTGAEAGLVVNNNAAAVLLALDTLAKGQEAIVSRGQLVEIGGSFRIPDVMKKSGARLVEVGATNRTHLWDYQQAITEETALLLKVHTSNYRMIGFTSEVPLDELVALGRKEGIAVMEDLGSGSFVDLSKFGLDKEPTVQEVVKSGVDVVTFSGDKLLGGPQAGLIVGRKDIIDRIKKNPLNRALRIDKFTLAGLEAIFRLYLDEQSVTDTVPTLAMLSMEYDVVKSRATRLVRRLKKEGELACEIASVDTESRVGGGALPEQGLRSRAVTLSPASCSLNQLEVRLRTGTIPVIGRIEDNRLILDMRTVADKEVPELAAAIIAVCKDES